ncbi:putative 2OG-Fe(II) oxygenase [Hyphomonas sp.]|uniref:putative 2OG-Fe(II) oxygenase n=1 Tax=Hyphomonas sp. TaxID=87 RepID=UPI00391C8D48
MLRTLQDLTRDANALKAQGRIGAAIEIYKDAVRQFPTSAVALHNLAAAYGDAGNHVDADRVAAMAQQAGLNGPETWLVRARSRFAMNDFNGAETAYTQAIIRQPDNAAARMELAQLIWVRTGDQNATLKVVETPPGSGAAEEAFFGFLQAQVLEHMEETQAALDLMLPLVVKPGYASQLRAPMLAFASQLAAETGDAPGAVALAEQAVRLAEPGDPGALEAEVRAHIAAGDGAKAVPAAAKLLRLNPNNQRFIALQATAWRLAGDPRYAQVYDYQNLVRTAMIAVPAGWPTLEAYLADLAVELKQAHPFKAHPFGHSVRRGSQKSDILSVQTRAISAFVEAITPPINAFLDTMGPGSDPLRSRRKDSAQMIGNWSVWLRPDGHHADHVHPDGWMSSACYIELPPAVNAGGKEGWLRFGKPGIPAGAGLPAEHWVQPKPGLLALFPSYMWHGTETFSGNEPRLTIAFDLVPS